MDARSSPAGLGRIFRFWAPMASTWLMMALEAPLLAAIIARLADPKENLAAFGVAFSVAILIEAPVIMILSASTALVLGPVSFLRLRRFTHTLNLSLTLFMLAMLLTPAWRWIAFHAIGLPPSVVELTQVALVIMVPWPGAIGYRRFYQGLLIRQGLTRFVALGTVVRLLTMSATSLSVAATTTLPGCWVAATALSAGVLCEALVNRLLVRAVVRGILRGDDAAEPDDAAPTYRRIVSFYWPLAMTSVIGLAVHPAVTFFMGHARAPLESLAVLPVVNALSFVFRSAGLAYQEVAIALLAVDERNVRAVGRFAELLALGASAAMALIAFTPLAGVWFGDVSGLTVELTGYALLPTRVLVLLPALSVLLSAQRALLVHGRVTAPITWATAIEVGGILLVLLVCIRGFDAVGVTAAAIAFVVGRFAGNLYLLPPCARVLKSQGGVAATG